MPLVYKNPKVSFSNRQLNTKMTRLRKELCKYNDDISYINLQNYVFSFLIKQMKQQNSYITKRQHFA